MNGSPTPPRLAAFLVVAVLSGCGPADDAGEATAGSTVDRDRAAASTLQTPSQEGEVAPGATSREAESPRGSIRALFVGTSLTAGLGLLRDADRFTDRIQDFADSVGMAVDVVNAGVSGETTAGGVTRIDWLLQGEVDVLVVELGANDGLRGLGTATMKENLREIIRRTRARYPEVSVVLAGMEAPPNLGPRYTSEFREAFRTLAREEEVVFVPFLLEGVAGSSDLNQADRIHPNARGHDMIARTLWPTLETVFVDALRSRS